MRAPVVLVLLGLPSVLAACDRDAVVDSGVDPRLDPSTWPTTVGGDRPARVVAPSDWDGEPLALVLLLHGYGADAAVQDAYLGVSPRVDRGFVLVLPDGTVDADGHRFWNATEACCDFYGTGVDDVGYLTGLVGEVTAAMPIDPDRVAVYGHSNGGFMAYRLACDRSDLFTTVASLAGATFLDESECHADEPVQVLEIHGDADTDVVYAGTPEYPGAEETVGRWAARNGCTGALADQGTADYDQAVDGDEAELEATTGCGAADADLWRLRGSGHVPIPNDAFKDDVVDWILTHGR